MTHIDTGVQGAKRQSWYYGPREVLKTIIEDIGADDLKAVYREFIERAREADRSDRSIINGCLEYWASHTVISLLPKKQTRTQARAQARTRAEQVSKVIVQRVKTAAGVMLLDLMQPHGKKLRDSTGGECLVIGGWLAAVGSQMKPQEKVGTVFTEKQLQKIFNNQ